MHKLRNEVMAYEWGSRTAIARLVGRPAPSPGPEAELWIGAHASAPSAVEGGGTLLQAIERDPVARLGSDVRARFGDRLPFLLKVLAVDVPLSLQAHPDREQARAGFEREERLGLAADARERCYRDASHKPEVLCALTPFEALCGFRPRRESLDVLERLGVAGLDVVGDPLRGIDGPGGMKAAFSALMSLGPSHSATLVEEVARACRERGGARDRDHLAWTARLAVLHPGDPGVIASLLLNFVRLKEGEALSLAAGSLHSYLGGTGVELMASSDNVLRGGLTTKHVDVAGLVSILDFCEEAAGPVPVRALSPQESEYVTGTEDFRLTRIEADGGGYRPARRGPELLLCVSGAVRLEGDAVVTLAQGESAFVSAADGAYAIRGKATLFRATVGDVD